MARARLASVPTLPELPEELWAAIWHRAVGSAVLVRLIKGDLKELFTAVKASWARGDCVDVEERWVQGIGDMRLVDRGAAKALWEVQLLATWHIANRKMRKLCTEAHLKEYEHVQESASNNFDDQSIDLVSALALRAGTGMGLRQGIMHMLNVSEATFALAFGDRKFGQCMGAVDFLRHALAVNAHPWDKIATTDWQDDSEQIAGVEA